MQHLAELRKRLILTCIYLILGCVVGFSVSKPVVALLIRPIKEIQIDRPERVLKVRISSDGVLKLIGDVDQENLEQASPYRLHYYLPDTAEENPPDFIFGNNLQKPVFFNPIDPIMLYFKAALIVGMMLAMPFILHQLWLFVSPGMLENEKKFIVPILSLGSILFPTGAAFAYFMLRIILDFLMNFQSQSLEPQLEVFRFVNFELKLMVGFGVVFELPLVIMLLTALGVVHPKQLRQWRPYSLVGIATLSMFLTPPDPFSMLIMMMPLILLYEISIWLSMPIARNREENQQDDENEDTDNSEQKHPDPTTQSETTSDKTDDPKSSDITATSLRPEASQHSVAQDSSSPPEQDANRNQPVLDDDFEEELGYEDAENSDYDMSQQVNNMQNELTELRDEIKKIQEKRNNSEES